MQDSSSTTEDQVRAEYERDKARDESQRSTRRAIEAERAYRASLDGNIDSVRRFTRSLGDLDDGHRRSILNIRNFRNEINETERTARILATSLTSILAPALKSLAVAGAIGIGGGAVGLLGAGGLQALSVGIVGVVEAIKDFSGAIALLPAGVSSLVAVMSVLAISFRGVGDALGAAMANDPKKFAEAIKEMGPATQSVIKQLASFTNSFKGAMSSIQDAFFRPFVNQVQPIIQMWMPALTQAGQQIAGALGSAGRVVAQFLQQPQTMAAFQTFMTNLLDAFRRLEPAIQPILQAFNTLNAVGSSFLPQIADTIAKIANSFNAWIQNAAASGQLQNWIQRSLDAFGDLFSIIKNTGIAINNIGAIVQNLNGGGLLSWLADVTAHFRAWTESVEGQSSLTKFFSVLKAAGDALWPVLKVILGGIGDLVMGLAGLGTEMAPGILQFFVTLRESLNTFVAALTASAPALGSILVTIGEAFGQIINAGDFPRLFGGIAQAVRELAPLFVDVANAVVLMLSSMSTGQIELILGVLVAMKGFHTVAPIFQSVAAAIKLVSTSMTFLAANPVVLVIAAIAALAAGFIYLYNTNEDFRNGVQGLWEKLKEFGLWVVNSLVGVWTTLSNAIGGAWRAVVDFIGGIGNSISEAWNTITQTVSGWFATAYNWGQKLVSSIIDGVYSMFAPLTNAASWVAQQFADFINTDSPAKKGPLNAVAPNEMGAKLAGGVASGITDGAPGVANAASGMAGAFTSAGTSGRSGGNFGGGHSGFNNFINTLVQDLQAVLSVVRNSWGLFQKVSDIFVQSTKIVASIWNNGDNPLTRRGGVASPDKGLLPEQQLIPGVDQMVEPGVAPMPELTPQGNVESVPVVPQQNVPGVPSPPNAPPSPPGSPPGPGSAGGEQIVPIVQKPDGTWTSPDPTWAALLERESGGRNIGQQITDANGGPGSPNAAQGLFQITPETWRANGGEEFAPNPLAATPEQQARVAARILNSDPGAWGFYRHPGREDPTKLRTGLVPFGGAAPPPAGAVPGAGQTPPPFKITPFTTSAKSPRGGVNPDKLLVHTQEGGDGDAMALAKWMDEQGDRSYNYIIGKDGNVVRPVHPDEAAWSVGSPGNAQSINAVVAGSRADWSREQWLANMPQLQTMAALFAQDAAARGIPVEQLGPGVSAGIGGHDWVSQFLGGTDHTDPGPNFPWQEFMGMVRSYGAGGQQPATVTGETPTGTRIIGTPPADTFLGGPIDPTGTFTGQEPDAPFNPGPRAPGAPAIPPEGEVTPGKAPPGFELRRFPNGAIIPVRKPGGAPTPGGKPAGPGSPPEAGWRSNPASRASTGDVSGIPKLTPNNVIPAEIQELAGQFGLVAKTRDTGNSLHEAGFAFDITPLPGTPPERMNEFANFVQANLGSQTLELIHFNEKTGQKWGIDNAKPYDFGDTYQSHGTFGDNAHVHWATDVLPQRGGQVPTPPGAPPRPPAGPGATFQGTTDDDWMTLPGGWDINQPIPPDVIAKNLNISPQEAASLPPMFYNAQPGTVTNVPVPPGGPPANYQGPGQVSPRGTISVPVPTPGGTPGFPETEQSLPFGAKTPLDAFVQGMSAAGSIAGDAFAVADNYIKSIGATANILDSLVRGPSSTEDIMALIDNYQQYITTAASVAKLVGSIAGVVGAAGSADPTGGTAAGAGAVSAIAGVIQSALEATNMAIDLGQEVWHQVSKYAAIFAGTILGGPDTGFLGGNVRMLLNTATGQIQAYSEDNPLNKATHNLPEWMSRSYGGLRPETQPPRLAQVNIYAGPGQTPRDMMNESMWLVNNGGAAASVAGME